MTITLFWFFPQGKWAPRKIANPAHFDDETPYYSLTPIKAVGFELWSVNKDFFFDNIIITSELAVANNWAREGYVHNVCIMWSYVYICVLIYHDIVVCY